MKGAQVTEELKKRGLKCTGKVAEKKARLQEYVNTKVTFQVKACPSKTRCPHTNESKDTLYLHIPGVFLFFSATLVGFL